MDADILKSFLTLMLSVAVIGFVFFVFKRYSKKLIASTAEVDIRVISKVAINQKNQLVAVRAEGKILLLGVTEKSISLIAELGNDDNNGDIVPIVPTADELKKVYLNSGVKSYNSKVYNDKDADLSFKKFIKSSLKIGGN